MDELAEVYADERLAQGWLRYVMFQSNACMVETGDDVTLRCCTLVLE